MYQWVKPQCVIPVHGEHRHMIEHINFAKKMQVPVIQGVGDKVLTLSRLAKDKSYTMSKLLYVGNDLNDYYAMKLCGFSACPIDSHKKIKKIATFVLNTEGGSGVVRELVEEIIGLDFLKTLYP